MSPLDATFAVKHSPDLRPGTIAGRDGRRYRLSPRAGDPLEGHDLVPACRWNQCGCCTLPGAHAGDCTNQRGRGLSARYVHVCGAPGSE